MQELQKAIDILNSSDDITIVINKNDTIITSEFVGIKPLMTFLREDRGYFAGAFVADKIVGKAAAMLLVLGGAREVYGKVMSRSAADYLKNNNIKFEYETLAEYIQNRTKTGKCPMELATEDIDDPAEGFDVLEKTIKKLMAVSD